MFPGIKIIISYLKSVLTDVSDFEDLHFLWLSDVREPIWKCIIDVQKLSVVYTSWMVTELRFPFISSAHSTQNGSFFCLSLSGVSVKKIPFCQMQLDFFFIYVYLHLRRSFSFPVLFPLIIFF